MNNPLTLIDPSGNSWLSSLVRDIGHFFEKFWKPILAIVLAFVTYGYASELIVAEVGSSAEAAATTAAVADGLSTAEAVTYGSIVGGEAAAAASWTTGALAGAAAGAVGGAVIYGGRGALVGALSGFAFAANGAAWGYVRDSVVRALGQAVISGAIDGEASQALGGTFRQGLLFGSVGSFAMSLYEAVTHGFDPTLQPGGDAVAKNPGSPDYQPANPVNDNVGVASEDPSQYQGRWWPISDLRFEGSPILSALNYIPGFNSFATFHDWLLPEPGWVTSVINLPSMVPAFAVNAAALSAGVPDGFLAANSRRNWW